MSNFNSIESFLEEIKSDFRKYDEQGLIDEASIYRDIEFAIKRFGNDINELCETVVTVKNGEVQLPSNFCSLYIAYMCEPAGWDSPTIEKHELQDSMFYIERIERDKRWDSCDPCCTEESEKIITENLYFRDHEVNFRYKNPTLLKLGKSFNKNQCHSKCRNKFVRDCPSEITINKNTLYANFDTGTVYMQYYGLPVDADGQLVMPESFNGHITDFIEYYVKERLIERLILNNDAKNLSNMYTLMVQKRGVALKNASSEIKMNQINPDRLRRRWRRLNTIEALKYSLNF